MDEKSESEIRNLIAQGETIRAIKLYREATGAGLVHAKSAIENHERTGSFDDTAFTAETGPLRKFGSRRGGHETNEAKSENCSGKILS